VLVGMRVSRGLSKREEVAYFKATGWLAPVIALLSNGVGGYLDIIIGAHNGYLGAQRVSQIPTLPGLKWNDERWTLVTGSFKLGEKYDHTLSLFWRALVFGSLAFACSCAQLAIYSQDDC